MKIPKTIKFSIGVVIFVALIWGIGTHDVTSTLLKMNTVFLVPLYFLTIVKLMITSFNMKILINPLKKLPFRKFTRYYLYTWVASLVLPARIGEFSLAYFLHKENVRVGESTAAIFLDKLITLVFFTTVSIFGFFLFFSQGTALIYFIVTVALWASIIVLFATQSGRMFMRKLLSKRYEKKFEGFSKTLFDYLLKRKKLISINAVITVISWLVQTAVAVVAFLSFNQPIDFATLFIITSVATFVASIPLTSNGLGIREGVYVFLLSAQGFGASVIISTAIIQLIISYTLAAAIACSALSQKRSMF